MRIGIIGGRLQGTEVAYLAREAGLRTMVFDRDPRAPAFGLADEAVTIDVTSDPSATARLLEGCDAVIPANENQATLECITRICEERQMPLLFDPKAYRTTSSKIATNLMMRAIQAPMPNDWPECGFPAIVKPSGCSGSHGVVRVDREEDLQKAIEHARAFDSDVVMQEFVSGPSISLEVIGHGQEAVALQTTQVVLDEHYDCKMVLAPAMERMHDDEQFVQISERMATCLDLQGLMDVEAIVSGGIPKVLELDARFPSQTPSAVFHSTGWNMVGIMFDWFVRDKMPVLRRGNVRQTIYEHVRVRNGRLESFGEDMMSSCTDLRVVKGFAGSDVALTDISDGTAEWKATLITTGREKEETWSKREQVLHRIMEEHDLREYYDSVPAEEFR